MRRVVLIRGGRVYRDGPKEQVLEARTLTALFGVPSKSSSAAGITTCCKGIPCPRVPDMSE